MDFRSIKPKEIEQNVFDHIGTDWMLVTAGNESSYNTMTASWGQMGILWNKPVATVYLRPQRYTLEFMEREETFSLSFFKKGTRRDELNLLGSKSGRDGDKISESGLEVTFFSGTPAFEEAELVLCCRKLFVQDLHEACFLDEKLRKRMYPQKDYHRMYVGAIEAAFKKKKA